MNMGEIEKVVLIKNAVETLGYFSEQIALEFQEQGIEVYFVDYDDLYESIEGFKRFATKGNTALITFNFIGFSGEEVFIQESGATIWETYGMHCVNILVDHPLYYHAKLVSAPANMMVYCIDKEHVSYIKRFYPEISARFLPTAGNIYLPDGENRWDVRESGQNFGRKSGQAFEQRLEQICSQKNRCYDRAWNYENELISYGKREYDVVFTANYVPVESLFSRFNEMDAEYAAFYKGILDDLIMHPTKSVDAVMERHIRNELGAVSDTDMRGAMAGMAFLDLCARTYYRGEIIRELAEQGIRVHAFGADWEQLSCKRVENIICNGRQINSAECVKVVRNAKITLNIMPWFKDGAHDRIFTAMLQKSVALTDDSKYLREEFKDGEDIVYFSLEERKYLPDIVHRLLRDEENAMRIAGNGYRKTYEKHTWRVRAYELLREFDG